MGHLIAAYVRKCVSQWRAPSPEGQAFWRNSDTSPGAKGIKQIVRNLGKRHEALTPSDDRPIGTSGMQFNQTDKEIIENMRIRIQQLEYRLEMAGLLEPSTTQSQAIVPEWRRY